MILKFKNPDRRKVQEEPAFRHQGDPAQALLNVLGRFQRHYLRGKEGAEQFFNDVWSLERVER